AALVGLVALTIGYAELDAAYLSEADQRKKAEEAVDAERMAKAKAEKAAEAERRAKVKAEEATAAESQAKAEAELANQLAQKRLGQIEKANNILASIFRDLNPREEEKGGPPLKEQLLARLDQAAAQLEEDAIGDPVTVARVQFWLGETYLGLGEAPKAIA